jgi:HEAT repeat protein
MAALDQNRHGRALLLAYAADADPGVRWHVARSLGRHPLPSPRTDAALVERLVKDHWPHVRRSAAAALGRRCTAPDPARALFLAVDRDKDVEVGRTALGALVDCKARGIRAKLFAVAADRKRPTELRARAVILIGQLGEAQLRPQLIKLFKKLRGEAWSRRSGIRLAAAACSALADVGGKPAIDTILRAARDGSFPQLQAGCITALSKRCPSRALPLFDRYRGSSNRSVSLAARSAARKCRKP